MWTQREIGTTVTGGSGTVNSVAFSPDGPTLARGAMTAMLCNYGLGFIGLARCPRGIIGLWR
jgi:hypothetical protein